eukprot:9651505-Alexandrium_andersonii.AAC.1
MCIRDRCRFRGDARAFVANAPADEAGNLAVAEFADAPGQEAGGERHLGAGDGDLVRAGHQDLNPDKKQYAGSQAEEEAS